MRGFRLNLDANRTCVNQENYIKSRIPSLHVPDIAIATPISAWGPRAAVNLTGTPAWLPSINAHYQE